MRYLLDTCVISDLARGYSQELDAAIAAAGPEDLCISSITVYELQFGLAKAELLGASPHKTNLLRTRQFIQTISTLSFDFASAEASGKIRAQMESLGTPIGPFDLLLAGTAMAHGLTFVTRNRKEFSRIQGLQLADWYRA